MTQEFVVSGDSHVIEPMDLFTERLPKNLRDKALTQTEFELEEPLVPGGHTVFRTVHAPGYEGWTVSRYRQNTGPTPDWYPDQILRDMDRDGVDATVLFSNFALFATYTDDHEVALAHARVYNDWVAETYRPYADRMRPMAAIPTTDIGDAVKEIERCVGLGLRGLFLPEHPQPLPYHADEYEPLWACAEANGLPIFFHLAAGGANTKTGNSITGDAVKGILTAMAMGKNKELTNATLAARTMGGGNSSGMVPMRIISELDRLRCLRPAPEPDVERDRVQRRLAGPLHVHDGQGLAHRDRAGPRLVDGVPAGGQALGGAGPVRPAVPDQRALAL